MNETSLSLLDRVRESSDRQQDNGTGELVMVRSSDSAANWSEPMVVYAPADAEPRTMNTITTLASGRLIGLVVERANRHNCRWMVAKTGVSARSWGEPGRS